MLRTLLLKKIDKNIRFYEIAIHKTLFGEFIVESVYGNITNLKPTGTRKKFYSNELSAIKYYKQLLSRKKKKGYI